MFQIPPSKVKLNWRLGAGQGRLFKLLLRILSTLTCVLISWQSAVVPRPLGVQYTGALYHVLSHGDQREAIFLNDQDLSDFLHTLAGRV